MTPRPSCGRRSARELLRIPRPVIQQHLLVGMGHEMLERERQDEEVVEFSEDRNHVRNEVDRGNTNAIAPTTSTLSMMATRASKRRPTSSRR